jgi:hypothetical protein
MSGAQSPQDIRRANARDFAELILKEYGIEIGFDQAGAEWLDDFIQS